MTILIAVPTEFTEAIHLDWNADNWKLSPTKILVNDPQIFKAPYTIYYTTCIEPISPGCISEPSLLGFYLDPHVNYDGTNYILGNTILGSNSELKGFVATVASQVIPTGVGDASRNNADDAMKETYRDVDYHPWK